VLQGRSFKLYTILRHEYILHVFGCIPNLVRFFLRNYIGALKPSHLDQGTQKSHETVPRCGTEEDSGRKGPCSYPRVWFRLYRATREFILSCACETLAKSPQFQTLQAVPIYGAKLNSAGLIAFNVVNSIIQQAIVSRPLLHTLIL